VTDDTVARLAAVLAMNAEVLGMQAENMQRAAVGSSMAYTADNFFRAADMMREAAK